MRRDEWLFTSLNKKLCYEESSGVKSTRKLYSSKSFVTDKKTT